MTYNFDPIIYRASTAGGRRGEEKRSMDVTGLADLLLFLRRSDATSSQDAWWPALVRTSLSLSVSLSLYLFRAHGLHETDIPSVNSSPHSERNTPVRLHARVCLALADTPTHTLFSLSVLAPAMD